MPIIDNTKDFNVLEEMGKSGDKNYEALLKERKKVEDLLKRELERSNKDMHLIDKMQDYLNGINETVERQNEVFKEFHDEFARRVGEGKDFDVQMLKDFAEFQTAQIEAVKAIENNRETIRKSKDELKALRQRYREGGKANGAIVAGITPEEEHEFKERENELENELRHLRGYIHAFIKRRNALRTNAAIKYGEGSYLTNEMDNFSRDKEAQVKWMERQAELEEFCLEKEFDYNSAVREGNKILKDRQEQLKKLSDAWDTVKKFTLKAADYWKAYNHQAIADSKMLGITTRATAQAYNESLMESSKQLSRNFGMTRDEAMKLQNTFAQTTGKAALLTQEQMSDIAAASSLMGEQNVQSAISGMEQMGATSEQAMELMDRNYAKAVNNGLNVVKASETLVKNLALANQFSFRDGVEGLMRMSIESQRIKLNVAEVAKVANKFSTIEGAIQGSAQLQMLGGAGAMYGGNPMAMMFESLADPEALYQRMGKMFSEQAYFDKRKGEAVIDPLQLAIIKEQAKAMGMDENEAVTTAKQQAKLRAIREDWRSGRISTFNNATEEQRAAIENKAQYSQESGWTVTYVNREGEKQTRAVNDLDSEAMADIMKDNLEPVEDIRGQVRKIASNLVSMKDRWTSLKDMFWTSNAQTINPFMKFGDNTLTAGAQGKGLAGTVTNALSTPGLSFALGLGGSLIGSYAMAKGKKWATETYINRPSTAPEGTPIRGTGTTRPSPSPTGSTPSKWGKWGGRLGGAAIVATSAWQGYSNYTDAEERYNAEERAIISETAEGSRERRQRIIEARNARNKEQSGAIGEATGGAIGGLAGMAVGAKVGGMIGTSVAPGVGTVVGLALGAGIGWAGSLLGKSVGESMAKKEKDYSEETKGTIKDELSKINEGDEDDNIKKMVLPVESIDYNVAMIAQMLGVSSASAAKGNVYLETASVGVTSEPISYERVAPVYDSGGGVSSPVGGTVNLKVDGAIELRMGGSNVGNISPTELTKLIQNDSLVRGQIIDLIVNENNRRGNGGKYYADGANQRQGNIAFNH